MGRIYLNQPQFLTMHPGDIKIRKILINPFRKENNYEFL